MGVSGIASWTPWIEPRGSLLGAGALVKKLYADLPGGGVEGVLGHKQKEISKAKTEAQGSFRHVREAPR